MTALEAISLADRLEPNQFDTRVKLGWLSRLDGQIYHELLESYDPELKEPQPYITGAEELLAPQPYAQQIYCHYIQAMIAAYNYETAKYDQQILLYNSAFGQYRDQILRRGRHQKRGSGFVF